MSEVKLQVEIRDAGLCPRYQAVVMELTGKAGGRFLGRMAVDLAKAGMRSIDPVVDLSNYLMLLTGQPLHTFDYDKLVSVGGLEEARIIVRAAREGEKMTLLDGREVAMSEGDIVITSNDVPVALAGAMGGANTVIDGETRRIVVESATFNLYNLRGTQFRHGIFSEAITRFTKGQPAGLTEPVIRRFMEMAERDYGLKTVSEAVDEYPGRAEARSVEVTVAAINETLGSEYGAEEIMRTLDNVGFKVGVKTGGSDGVMRKVKVGGQSTLIVYVPWWRTDIHIPEDVIEEVGRLLGYDGIPARLPGRDFAAPDGDAFGEFKARVRGILSELGANEVLSYSFVSGKLISGAGQDLENSYKITNSISPELEYVRQSIVPSLLEKVRPNVKDGFSDFSLFEVNQVYRKGDGLTEEKVPVGRDDLGLVVTGDYYLAKKYATELLARLGVAAEFTALDATGVCGRPFEPKRAAQIVSADGKVRYGSVGEVRTSVRRAFKLPEVMAGLELNLGRLLEAASPAMKLAERSGYPAVERDLTLRVASGVEYGQVEGLVSEVLRGLGLQFTVTPVGIYQGEDKGWKNVTLRVSFASFEKTLASGEIEGVVGAVTARLQAELKAEVV
jgi:phenylalanyl-tRNA synthetase beta chain